MMIKTTVLAIVICALLVAIMPTASADAWVNWKDQSAKQYMQVTEVVNAMPSLEGYVWQFGNSFGSPGFLLDDSANNYHAADYPQRLRIVGGGSGDWQQPDDQSIPIYVRLVTKIKNTGAEDWTDFHLRAISGCYVYPKYVMDSGLWSRYWNYDGNSNGWDYVMDSTYDPSWGSDYGEVHPNEYFSAETWIAVTSPTGNFEVELWPTAVPEPGAFVTLASGLIALGAGIRRRKIS